MNYKETKIIDVIVDKKGREWPIIKLHKGIYGFRDCPIFAKYNEYGKDTPFKKSNAYKETIKWLDENMTPEQRKRYGEPFLATLYNIVGEKAHEIAEPVEGEIQFDYYKDWHNRIKLCITNDDEDQDETGWPYWTDSPCIEHAHCMCRIDIDVDTGYNFSDNKSGISPCFAVKSMEEE